MNDGRIEKWNREFEEAGADKVRGDLMLGRFDKEKTVAARRWLELSDTRNWRKAAPPGAPRGSFIQAIIDKRNAKVWGYVIAGGLLAFGVARLLRRLF